MDKTVRQLTERTTEHWHEVQDYCQEKVYEALNQAEKTPQECSCAQALEEFWVEWEGQKTANEVFANHCMEKMTLFQEFQEKVVAHIQGDAHSESSSSPSLPSPAPILLYPPGDANNCQAHSILPSYPHRATVEIPARVNAMALPAEGVIAHVQPDKSNIKKESKRMRNMISSEYVPVVDVNVGFGGQPARSQARAALEPGWEDCEFRNGFTSHTNDKGTQEGVHKTDPSQVPAQNEPQIALIPGLHTVPPGGATNQRWTGPLWQCTSKIYHPP